MMLKGLWWGFVAGLVVLVALAPGCCSHAAAIRQAGRTAAANWGEANDARGENSTRRLGRVNAIAWEAQYYCLSGEWRDPAKREDVLRALGVTSEDELLAAWGEVDVEGVR